MDPLDQKIDEALALEVARDKAAQDARDLETSRVATCQKRQQEFRDKVLIPVLDDLDARLRAKEPVHFVEYDYDDYRQNYDVMIQEGDGDTQGRTRLALRFILGEEPGEAGCARVSTSVSDQDDRWLTVPALSQKTYQLNTEQVANGIMAEWIRAAGGRVQ